MTGGEGGGKKGQTAVRIGRVRALRITPQIRPIAAQAPPPRSRPHYPQPSEPGSRWVLPGVARTPAPEWRLFVTQWRQIPPYTAQSPARTQLLPDACPTSTWVVWTEFLNPTSVANSWRGQQSPLALPTHRE